MEEKIKAVITEISEMCEKAHINEKPENFIHILIAYLRTPIKKDVIDYAINGIVANIICDAIKTCKNKEMMITTSELKILCEAIKLQDDTETEIENIKEEKSNF